MNRRCLWHAVAALSSLVLGGLCMGAHAAPVNTERARIAQARAEADATLAKAEAECKQRFVVTSCLIDARRAHRATVEPLREESLLLDERERKQRAADRLDQVQGKALAAQARAASSASSTQPPTPSVDAASAPDVPGVRPKLRQAAMAADSNAEAGSAASNPERAADIGSGASAVPAGPAPLGRTKSPSKRLTPAPDPAAAASAENKAAEARAHREEVERRNAERDAKRPPAKGLPVPAAASAVGAAGQ
jgi:hypothetical protein